MLSSINIYIQNQVNNIMKTPALVSQLKAKANVDLKKGHICQNFKSKSQKRVLKFCAFCYTYNSEQHNNIMGINIQSTILYTHLKCE